MHTVLRARAKPKLLWLQPVPRLGEDKNHVLFRRIRHISYEFRCWQQSLRDRRRPFDQPYRVFHIVENQQSSLPESSNLVC